MTAMYDAERMQIEAVIREYCAENDLPQPEMLQWSPLPFAGEWGISTSFFQLAAQEARRQSSASSARKPVPQRAQGGRRGLPGFLPAGKFRRPRRADRIRCRRQGPRTGDPR